MLASLAYYHLPLYSADGERSREEKIRLEFVKKPRNTQIRTQSPISYDTDQVMGKEYQYPRRHC